MADRMEIVRKIAGLAEELGRAVDAECAAATAEVRAKADELVLELESARARGDEAVAARQGLERELEVAEKRIETLVQKLKDARQAAAEAGEEAQKALRRQLEALQAECDEARAELEQERSVRKRLEKGAAADDKRLGELEKALAGGKAAAGPEAGGDRGELARLQAALEESRAGLADERRARESAERELDEAHHLIASLEKALKESRTAAAVPVDASQGLADKLRDAEARVAQEREALAEAQRRIAELEAAAERSTRLHVREDVGELAAAVSRAPAEKPLPHELRPAPKPGAAFHPDWDLRTLPCKSADQVLQAWESVSNVQLMLEGYPSQYCAAFLVVLKQGRSKHLYIVFNLKGSKHTLFCVPSKSPADEAALNKTVNEGLKYLQMSGFELEKIRPADVDHVLGCYFTKG